MESVSKPKAVVIGILIGLAIVSGWLAFSEEAESKEYVSLERLFLRAPNTPYLPTTYVFGIEVDEILFKIIECESGGNPNAWNKDDPNDGSKGILQFQEPTFQRFCVKKYGLENDIWSPEIQIKCAEKMLDEGLINHWSCGKKMLDSTS